MKKLFTPLICLFLFTHFNAAAFGCADALDTTNHHLLDDENFFRTENDQVNQDIIFDLTNYAAMQARKAEGGDGFQSYNPPCAATVDTSLVNSQKKLSYYFNGGINCSGRHRSGMFTVQLTQGNHWSDSSAVITFTFSNYVVTRIVDGKSITFNGTKTLKNLDGSNLVQWLTVFSGTGSLYYQERAAGMQTTFSGGATSVWNTAFAIEYSYDNASSDSYFNIYPDTSINSYINVSAWGTNRYGQSFVISAPSSLLMIYDGFCSASQPISGAFAYSLTGSAAFIVGYGFDQYGNPFTGSASTCAWGLIVQWVSGANTYCTALDYNSLNTDGIIENTLANAVSLYPNPVASQLTIHTNSSHNETVAVSIVNVLGEAVPKEETRSSNDLTINIQNLTSGIYFLEMKGAGENGIVVKRFVKE